MKLRLAYLIDEALHQLGMRFIWPGDTKAHRRLCEWVEGEYLR